MKYEYLNEGRFCKDSYTLICLMQTYRSNEPLMRFSRKELFIVQEEIIESMNTPSSKSMIAISFKSAKNNSISIRTLHLRIKRQIRKKLNSFGNIHATIEFEWETEDCYDRKLSY